MTIDHDISTPTASIPAQPEALESSVPSAPPGTDSGRHVHGTRCYWDHRECGWRCAP